jgi:DNA-binding MarR family transcriptional regulator
MSTGRPEEWRHGQRVRAHDGFEDEFPDASPLATECFFNLGQVATLMLSELNRLLEGFTVPSYTSFNALAVVAGADEPLSPSVVAQRMAVTRPTITGVLHTLERHGWVALTAHPLDRRMRLVAPTQAGRALMARVLPEVHRFEDELFNVLDHGQQSALLGTLAVLAQRLASVTAEAGS